MLAGAVERERGRVDGFDRAEGVCARCREFARGRRSGRRSCRGDVPWRSLPRSRFVHWCRPSTAARPAAAIEQAAPTSPWQPTSAPEIEAFIFIRRTDGGGGEQKGLYPLSARNRAMFVIIAQNCRNDTGGTIGGRGDDTAAGGVLLVHRDRVEADPIRVFRGAGGCC